jgi:hypothetical protein
MMIRGIERRKIFRDDDDRQDMLDRLATLLPETGTVCYAWAFLDNHAHFLFRSLNPLRARLVSDLAQLADYPYCGHAAVLGRWPVCWQDAERQSGRLCRATPVLSGHGPGRNRLGCII